MKWEKKERQDSIGTRFIFPFTKWKKKTENRSFIDEQGGSRWQLFSTKKHVSGNFHGLVRRLESSSVCPDDSCFCLYITYIYICVYCISVYICIHIYIYIHIYTIFLNNTRVWEADRWRWRVVGVKATTGADLNPRPGRWKGSNKSCTRDEDESENTENRPLCRATLCNYFVERRFLHTIPRRTEESVTSTNTKT